jgi:hypothetical protein
MVDFTKHVKDWPAYVHEKLKNDWVLSPTCVDNCINYYLRHWEKDYYLLQVMYDNIGAYLIGADGTHYRIIPKEGLADYKQLQLSFRAPAPELNLPAYVLVKGIAS